VALRYHVLEDKKHFLIDKEAMMPAYNSPESVLEEIENLPDEAVVPRTLHAKGLTVAAWRKVLSGSKASNTSDAIRDFIERCTPPGVAPDPLTEKEIRDLTREVANDVSSIIAAAVETAIKRRLERLAKRR
jgi:hypothetical protein